ncbi:MAG: metallopeptidase TldD-related protein [candidate division WOR-3 bacterium]
MEKIIKEVEKRNIKKYEIFYEKRIKDEIKFNQNEPEEFNEKKEAGFGLRIIKDGKRGFLSFNIFQDPEEIIDKAIETSIYGKEIDIDFPSEKIERDLKIFYDLEWNEKERIRIGKEMVREISSRYKDLKVNISFSKEYIERKIFNSSGLDAEFRKSIFSYYLHVFGLTETGIIFIIDGESNFKPEFNFDKILKDVIFLLEKCKIKDDIKSGKYPVIFSPFSLEFFAWGIINGIDGKNFEKGITPLKDKKGERILSDKITIINDPEREDLTGSAPFDDEGTKTEKFKFIENGILKDFMVCLETSKRTGIKPRGNGFRSSFESLPMRSFSNFVIQNGEKSLEEMIKEIDYGLIIYETIGAGQSNILAGEYSFNVGLGFLIKNGEIKGRVKDAMISGNFYEDFKNIIAISKETKKYYNYEVPFILVSDIKVNVK